MFMLALTCPVGGPWLHAFTAKNLPPFCLGFPIYIAAVYLRGYCLSLLAANLCYKYTWSRHMLNRTRLQSPTRQESAAHSLLITSEQLMFSFIIHNWKLGMKWEVGSLNRKQHQQSLYLANTHKCNAFTNSPKHFSFCLRQRTLAVAKASSYILLGCKRRWWMKDHLGEVLLKAITIMIILTKMLVCKDTRR